MLTAQQTAERDRLVTENMDLAARLGKLYHRVWCLEMDKDDAVQAAHVALIAAAAYRVQHADSPYPFVALVKSVVKQELGHTLRKHRLAQHELPELWRYQHLREGHREYRSPLSLLILAEGVADVAERFAKGSAKDLYRLGKANREELAGVMRLLGIEPTMAFAATMARQDRQDEMCKANASGQTRNPEIAARRAAARKLKASMTAEEWAAYQVERNRTANRLRYARKAEEMRRAC